MKVSSSIKRFPLLALAFAFATTSVSFAWGTSVKVKFINRSNEHVAVTVFMQHMNGAFTPAYMYTPCLPPGREYTTDIITTTAVEVRAIPVENKFCEGKFLATVTTPPRSVTHYDPWHPWIVEFTQSEGRFKLAWADGAK